MAATSIAKMAVQLVANSAGFAAGLSPGRAAIKHMERDLHGLRNAGRTAFAGIGAYIGIASIRRVASEILNVSNSMENVVNQSKLIGSTPKEFLALGYAGDKVGVSMETIQTATAMMMKNMSGVGEESKKAQKALAFLGLTPDSLRAAGPSGALQMIAEGMEKYTDSFTRAGIASAIFGRQFAGIMPLIGQGAEMLRGNIGEAGGLSLVTDDDIQKVADYNDSIDKLRFIINSFKVKALSIITPDLIEMADKFAEKLKSVGPEFWDSVKSAVQDIPATFETIRNIVSEIKHLTDLCLYGLKQMALAPAMVGTLLDSLITKVGEFLPKIGIQPIGGFKEWLDSVKLRMQINRDALAKLTEVPQGLVQPNPVEVIRGATGTSQGKSSLFNGGTNNGRTTRIDEMQRLTDLADKLKEKLSTPFEGLQSTLSDYAAIGDMGLLDADKLAFGRSEALMDYVDSLKGLTDEGASAQTRLDILNSTVNDLDSVLSAGLITWEDYGMAVDQATAQFANSFKSMQEFLKTPSEKMNEKMGDLDFMFAQGMITADKYQYGQAKLWDELSSGAEKYGTQINNIYDEYKQLQNALMGGSQVESFGGIAMARAVGMFGGAGRGSGFMGYEVPSYSPAWTGGSQMGGQRAPHTWDANLRSEFQSRPPRTNYGGNESTMPMTAGVGWASNDARSLFMSRFYPKRDHVYPGQSSGEAEGEGEDMPMTAGVGWAAENHRAERYRLEGLRREAINAMRNAPGLDQGERNRGREELRRLDVTDPLVIRLLSAIANNTAPDRLVPGGIVG